jgi:hypothetical protein
MTSFTSENTERYYCDYFDGIMCLNGLICHGQFCLLLPNISSARVCPLLNFPSNVT